MTEEEIEEFLNNDKFHEFVSRSYLTRMDTNFIAQGAFGDIEKAIEAFDVYRWREIDLELSEKRTDIKMLEKEQREIEKRYGGKVSFTIKVIKSIEEEEKNG